MRRKHIIIHGIVVAAGLAAVAACWMLERLEFFKPLWLCALLALPLLTILAVKGISGLPPRTNTISVSLRAFLYTLVVLCLAEPQIVLRNDSLCVLFLLDHSDSIPEHIVEQELQFVNATAETKGRKDTAGIIVFGDNASVEVMPVKDLQVDRIYSHIGKNYTDIQAALELATAAFPADARKKIVLVTDGNENRGSLVEGVKFAAGNQVVTDVLPVQYDYEEEVLVEKIHLPDRIKENETFDLRVHILALQDGPADIAIFRNGVSIARENVQLRKGRNTYSVSLKIQEPGFYSFAGRVSTPHDTLVENNEASSYVYIQGESRILFVTSAQVEVEHLVQACHKENLEADVILPQALPDTIGMLQNYDCVVLANVGADQLSQNQMAMLQANVRDLGVGLIMIGGENSFGAGGYEGTPIEESLPVTMDIRQKKIIPKGALVLILHTCEFADGNYWAKEISKKAIDTLSPADDVGLLLYAQGEEWLFELQPAKNKGDLFAKIDGATPGDMPSFGPTMQMAYDGLSKSDAMVKHVIVISDGDPTSPKPDLIKQMAEDGITISAIAINPHNPRDVDLMKYLAYTTGGRYYFATDPRELPRIFVKEAKVVKRSLIFNQKFTPQLVLSTEITKGVSPRDVPPLMAYVASTAKPRALVPMVSDNENQDPILAYWRYGLGKAVAFTSDASSNWGKEWVKWKKFEKLWGQIIRWASRKREKSNLRVRTEMSGSGGKLVIDAIDDKGRFINFLKLNGRMVDPEMKGKELRIAQTAPGRYEADFEARKVGVNILNIGYRDPQTGGQGFVATGVSVPYSPEYQHLESNLRALRNAVSASGGTLLTGNPDTDRVFASALPPTRSLQPIWEYILMAALVLFFIDVVLRRVIITREDIASAFAAVKARVLGKGKAVTDKTMSALLERKKKTFEHVARPKREKHVFKEALDRAAEKKAGKPVDVGRELAEEMRPTPPPVTKLKEKKEGEPTTKGEEDKDSYTSRLLAAKKRARKQGKGSES